MNLDGVLRTQTRAITATAVCFLVGAIAGFFVLTGAARPIAGDGSVGFPVAGIAGAIAAGAFATSTLMHRRGETHPMPRWQMVVSDVAAISLTIVFAGVTALGVLLGSEILGVGLQGLELSALGGGLLAGVASAAGGRFAFVAGIRLDTGDLAGLLFGYLTIGTLFAMLTAGDPQWWEKNFSQLGLGSGAWAFNGTLMVAGLLIATVGAYIGRDLHRIHGDPALRRIIGVVGAWATTGIALAGVGIFPASQGLFAHNLAAGSALVLFFTASVISTMLVPGPPRLLLIVTLGTVVLVLAAVLGSAARLYSVTVLEAIVIALALLWMTTFTRVLAAVTPAMSRPSQRVHLLTM